MMFKPIVLIPVYNHGRTIEAVVQKVFACQLKCILVNDGSEPECRSVLVGLQQRYPDQVYLFEHAFNQGKGAAISTGLKAALELGFSHALQVDADGQHHLEDIPYFFEQAQLNPDAIICGYPIFDESVPKHRLYGRYLTHVWVWINTLSLRIKDSMCGFRVYPLQASVGLINKHSMFSRMSFDTEILVRADWSKISIINCPTKVHYHKDGVSHFLAFKDNALISAMHAWLFVNMLWRSPYLLWRLMSDPPKNLQSKLQP